MTDHTIALNSDRRAAVKCRELLSLYVSGKLRICAYQGCQHAVCMSRHCLSILCVNGTLPGKMQDP